MTEPNIEKITMRKVTWRLVPFLMLLYFVAYLDRVNVGFAALTMNQDVGLSNAAFGLGAGIFFVGYFLFEVPSNIILHRVGARRWIARIMFTWGVVSAAMAFVQGPVSFYILRFLLGAAEAGFFPGIILYLSYWFPARYRAGIIAMFMAAVPLSIALGSPLSGWLLSFDGLLDIKGWQWLFLIEAFPAIILAFFVLKYLTDKPEKATWLANNEREWLCATLSHESKKKQSAGEVSNTFKALVNPRILVLALVYFGTSAGLYTLGIWSPQLLNEFALSTEQIGLINAVPPIFAVIAMVIWGRHSDKTEERPWHVFFACIVASMGLFIASFAQSLLAVVIALIIVNIGVSSAKAPLWAMPSQFLSGRGAAAGIAAINSIGNLGGFFGPTFIGYIKSTTGGYQWGLIGVAISLAISACLVITINSPSQKRTIKTPTVIAK